MKIDFNGSNIGMDNMNDGGLHIWIQDKNRKCVDELADGRVFIHEHLSRGDALRLAVEILQRMGTFSMVVEAIKGQYPEKQQARDSVTTSQE